MSTNNGTNLTIRDVTKTLNPDGSAAKIAEIIQQRNPIVAHIPFFEANGITEHRTTLRTGQPAGQYRKANEGVANEKSTNAQNVDTIGSLESYSEVDEVVAEAGGNLTMNLLNESKAFIAGLGETVGSKVFYGDTDTTPEEPRGLHVRADLSTAENGRNVILGGGSGSDNSSINFVGWGEGGVYGVYPKGSGSAGLEMTNKGKETLKDANGNQYEGYRTHYKWMHGFVVENWKAYVRIANIDNSALTADKSGSSADLTDLIAQALIQWEASQMGLMPMIYMNRTIFGMVTRQAMNTTNVQLGQTEVFGMPHNTINGFPVFLQDSLTSTEATIS